MEWNERKLGAYTKRVRYILWCGGGEQNKRDNLGVCALQVISIVAWRSRVEREALE
jgi:hypothetical protein